VYKNKLHQKRLTPTAWTLLSDSYLLIHETWYNTFVHWVGAAV
jgi:hypothetical protein